MGEQENTVRDDQPAAARLRWLALALSVLALAGTAAQWLGVAGPGAGASRRPEQVATIQNRMRGFEERLQRQRDDLARLAGQVGGASAENDSLTARLARVEAALDKAPGGERGRSAWLLEPVGD